MGGIQGFNLEKADKIQNEENKRKNPTVLDWKRRYPIKVLSYMSLLIYMTHTYVHTSQLLLKGLKTIILSQQ